MAASDCNNARARIDADLNKRQTVPSLRRFVTGPFEEEDKSWICSQGFAGPNFQKNSTANDKYCERTNWFPTREDYRSWWRGINQQPRDLRKNIWALTTKECEDMKQLFEKNDCWVGDEKKRGHILKCCLRDKDAGLVTNEDCPPDYCSGTRSCESFLRDNCTTLEALSGSCRLLETHRKPLFLELLANACFKGGGGTAKDKLKKLKSTDICSAVCKAQNENCNLSELCKDSFALEDREIRENICACHFPRDSSIYTKFKDSLGERYVIPAALISGDPHCFYPHCKTSTYANKKDESKCPPVNVVSCLTNVQVDNTGAIIRGSPITVNSDQRCGEIKAVDPSKPPPKPEPNPNPNSKPDPNPNPAKPGDDPLGDMWLWIIGGVGVAVVVVFALVAAKKQQGPNEPTVGPQSADASQSQTPAEPAATPGEAVATTTST